MGVYLSSLLCFLALLQVEAVWDSGLHLKHRACVFTSSILKALFPPPRCGVPKFRVKELEFIHSGLGLWLVHNILLHQFMFQYLTTRPLKPQSHRKPLHPNNCKGMPLLSLEKTL